MGQHYSEIGITARLIGLLSVLIFQGFASLAPAGEIHVLDGDSLEIGEVRYDLYAVDAPEPGQRCRIKSQIYDCGAVARAALLDLTTGAQVICRHLQAASSTAALCEADGYDLSEGMAYTGWALADRSVSARYVPLEEAASQAKRGLWRGDFVSPADWRAGRRLPASE